MVYERCRCQVATSGRHVDIPQVFHHGHLPEAFSIWTSTWTVIRPLLRPLPLISGANMCFVLYRRFWYLPVTVRRAREGMRKSARA